MSELYQRCKGVVERNIQHDSTLLNTNDCQAVVDLYDCLENKWISLKDKQPEFEQGNKIFVHNGDYAFECEWDDGFWTNLGGDDFTHWMPSIGAPKD